VGVGSQGCRDKASREQVGLRAFPSGSEHPILSPALCNPTHAAGPWCEALLPRAGALHRWPACAHVEDELASSRTWGSEGGGTGALSRAAWAAAAHAPFFPKNHRLTPMARPSCLPLGAAPHLRCPSPLPAAPSPVPQGPPAWLRAPP